MENKACMKETYGVPSGILGPTRSKQELFLDKLILSMDIFSTLLDVANLKLRHPNEGRSFFQTLLARQNFQENRPLFYT